VEAAGTIEVALAANALGRARIRGELPNGDARTDAAEAAVSVDLEESALPLPCHRWTVCVWAWRERVR